MSEQLGLLDVVELFSTEEESERWFEEMRWPNGRACPDCGSLRTVEVKDRRPMPYRCKDCRHHFSVRKGTVMQSSKLPYQTWGLAIYIMATTTKGVSSVQLHKQLRIRQPTAWFLAQRLREGMRQGLEVFEGPIEADETYVGGSDKWKHQDKKGLLPKTIVAGVRDRKSGRVKAQVVEDVTAKSLQPFVNMFRKPSTPVYTDELVSYHSLENQQSVNHSAGQYVFGDVHTNGIEGFWSQLKRGIRGTYVSVSPHHLQRYVNEFAERQNRRFLPTLVKMFLIVKGMDNKTLRYQDLTGG